MTAEPATLGVRLALGRAGRSTTVKVPARAAASPPFSLDVAFQAAPGFTILAGPSGSGKSTLLGAIAGLLRPTSGRVTLGAETWFDARSDASDLAPQRRRVAIVFQSLALFPHMTAAQNVGYGMARTLDRSARRALGSAWLERLRVAHLADRRPPTFSGGEAQRVALARALATEPRVVLLDEPFSALDPALRRDLAAEVREVLLELRVPVLIVTHQLEEARVPGDLVVTLDRGRIVSESVQ